MNTAAVVSPPRWYRIVSVIALIWMLFGVAAWFMDWMTDESTVAELSEAQKQLYAARPQWLFILYGIAIFSGLMGALGLLLRRSWAVPALALSLLTALVQFAYTFFGLDAIKLLGPALALPFPMVIIAIGSALLVLAMKAKQRGWIAS